MTQQLGPDMAKAPQTFSEYLRLCTQSGVPPLISEAQFESSIADWAAMQSGLSKEVSREQQEAMKYLTDLPTKSILRNLAVSEHLRALLK